MGEQSMWAEVGEDTIVKKFQRSLSGDFMYAACAGKCCLRGTSNGAPSRRHVIVGSKGRQGLLGKRIKNCQYSESAI